MSFKRLKIILLILAITTLSCSNAFAKEFEDGKIYVWAEQRYSSNDNPFHSELTINGQLVEILSSNTILPIEEYLKKGWNSIRISTTPQQPANDTNELYIRIGPMYKDTKRSNKTIMQPVLWKFNNSTDWSFEDGYFSHQSGPDVKQVTLEYPLYWAGFENENVKLKTGDYILNAKPRYTSCNSPVIAAISVNGKPLSSFFLPKRRIVITPLLKPGKNSIKIVTHKIKNSFEDNDIEFAVKGPAVWSAGKNSFLLKPILSSKAMQGWVRDANTGQLINKGKPGSPFIERTLTFIVKEEPKKEEKADSPAAFPDMTGKPDSTKNRNKI